VSVAWLDVDVFSTVGLVPVPASIEGFRFLFLQGLRQMDADLEGVDAVEPADNGELPSSADRRFCVAGSC
jgi:hypothetical protein